MIWARTWEILSFLGMADDFSRIAHAPPDGSPGNYLLFSTGPSNKTHRSFQASVLTIAGQTHQQKARGSACSKYHVRLIFLEALPPCANH